MLGPFRGRAGPPREEPRRCAPAPAWGLEPALNDAVGYEREQARAEYEGDHGQRAYDGEPCPQVVVQRREVLGARRLGRSIVVPDVRHCVLSAHGGLPNYKYSMVRTPYSLGVVVFARLMCGTHVRHVGRARACR